MDDIVFKSIITTYGFYGATLEQIITDSRELLGLLLEPETLRTRLKTIPGVWFDLDRNWNEFWHVESEKSAHIQDMINKQKPKKTQWNHYNNNNYYHYNGRKPARNNKPYVNRSHIYHHRNQNRPGNYLENIAHLQDFEMLGDDFFLSIATFELGYRFARSYIQQCGLCISGQTIQSATRNVLNTRCRSDNFIINIGSVDILHGHELIDMQADFFYLLEAFRYKGIQPIVTTLAPLANAHSTEMKEKLIKFNLFLKSITNLHVIDISQCMLGKNGRVLFECYQTEARYVTGSCRPHVLWNKLGRQIILKHIKKHVV